MRRIAAVVSGENVQFLPQNERFLSLVFFFIFPNITSPDNPYLIYHQSSLFKSIVIELLLLVKQLLDEMIRFSNGVNGPPLTGIILALLSNRPRCKAAIIGLFKRPGVTIASFSVVKIS